MRRWVLRTFGAMLIFLSAAAIAADPMAIRLTHDRWECRGEGCLNTADIWRLAGAIRRESRRTGLPAELLAGLVMVENPWLDSTAVSHAGAFGLTQVMPFHFGNWSACPSEPFTISSQLCYGAEILSFYLRLEERRAERRALLRYNGCWSPGCRSYATAVQHAARRFENE